MGTPAERIKEFLRQWKLINPSPDEIDRIHVDLEAKVAILFVDDLEALLRRD